MSDKNVTNSNDPVEKIEYFEDKLHSEHHVHTGFASIAKAADNSLCEREELALGDMSDNDLAKEVLKLQEYLQLPSGIYYGELLKAIVHRLRFLSGRLRHYEGKEVFDMEDPTPNLDAARKRVQDYLSGLPPTNLNDILTHPGGGDPQHLVDTEVVFSSPAMEAFVRDNPQLLEVRLGKLRPQGTFHGGLYYAIGKPNLDFNGDGEFTMPKAGEDIGPEYKYVSAQSTLNMSPELQKLIADSAPKFDGSTLRDIGTSQTVHVEVSGPGADDLVQSANLKDQPYLVKVGTMLAYTHPVGGLLVSDNFERTRRDIRNTLDAQADVYRRTKTMFDRLCFFLGIQDKENLGAIAHKLVEKHNATGEGVFVVLRAAALMDGKASLEEADKCYFELRDLVLAINPGYGKEPKYDAKNSHESFFKTIVLPFPETGNEEKP